jgi:hypothetical protein
VSDYQNQVAGTLGNLAALLRARKEPGPARRLFEDALPYHEAALRANPRHPAYRAFLRNNLSEFCYVLLDLGDHAAAADAAGKLARAAVEPAEDAYNAACFLALCVPLAEKDGKLPEAGRQELARGYAGRAVEALRQAVRHGYRDVAQMKKDSDLDPLRRLDEFQKLLRELEVSRGP